MRLIVLIAIALSAVNCRSAKPVSASESFWRYTDDDLSYELLFKSDGHIYSYHPNDASPENDFWKQHGGKITLTMNDGYAIYKGRFINDSTITGKARSKGFQWKWSAKFVSKN